MIRHVILVTTCTLAVGLGTSAQEKKVEQSSLPPAVQKTVQEQSTRSNYQGLFYRARTRQEGL